MWGNQTAPVWMWLFGLVVIAGLVFLAVAVTWAITSSRPVPPGSDPAGATPGSVAPGSTGTGPAGTGHARQILDERFARGEIDADEYVSRRNTLARGS